MTIKTKKIIAREIIIFISVLLLVLLFFLGNLLFNNSKSRRLSQYDIERKLVVRSIDSLQITTRKLLNNNSIYKFLKENNLTNKDEASFLITYKNPDSAKYIYDFMLANKLTNLDDSSFYNKFLSPSDIDTYFRIQGELKMKQEQLKVTSNRHLAMENKILTNDKIHRNIIWFLAISFAIVYLLRPLVIILKWAIKTLSL